MGILPKIWGVRELAGLDLGGSWQRMLWGSVSSRDDPGVGLCIRGLGTRHCTCDLGTGLYIEVRSMGVRVKLAGVSHQVKKSLAPLTQIDLLTYIYRQKKKKEGTCVFGEKTSTSRVA